MNLLEIEDLEAFYGDFQALFGIGAVVGHGESIALVGANGAGKTTLLKSLVGLVTHKRGAIVFDGRDISVTSAEEIARAGIALMPEGRGLFPSLNVEENIRIGGFNRRPGFWDLAKVYRLFPLLQERRAQMPTTLSGGQQGLVAIGRALMANPKLLLCDEVSLGLSPIASEQIYRALAQIKAQGMSFVIVEQDVRRALAGSDRLYCLLEGRVTLKGPSSGLTTDAIAQAYFG